MGCWRLEICALPALLSAGSDHLERAVLSSAIVDAFPAAHGRDSVSLRGVPVQFCEFPPLQGALFLAQTEGSSPTGSQRI